MKKNDALWKAMLTLDAQRVALVREIERDATGGEIDTNALLAVATKLREAADKLEAKEETA